VVPTQALLPCQSASSPIQYANEPFLLLPRKERLTRPQWRGVQSKLLSVGAVPQWEAALKAAVPRPTSSQPHKVHKLQKCRAQVALLVTDRIQSPSKNQNLNATRQASLLCTDAQINHTEIPYHSTVGAREAYRRSKPMMHAFAPCVWLYCTHTLACAATSGSRSLQGPEWKQKG